MDEQTRETIRKGRERLKNGEANRPMDADEERRYKAWLAEAREDERHFLEWARRGFIGFGPPDDRTRSDGDTEPVLAVAAFNDTFSEYWLQTPPKDADPRPWNPAQTVLRVMDHIELREWTKDALKIEQLVFSNSTTAGCRKHRLEQAPGDRSSGIVGLEDDYYRARRALTAQVS